MIWSALAPALGDLSATSLLTSSLRRLPIKGKPLLISGSPAHHAALRALWHASNRWPGSGRWGSASPAIVLQVRSTTNWQDLYDTPVVSAACKARIGGVSFYVNKLTFTKASIHSGKTYLLQVLLHLRRRLLQGRQKQQPALGPDLTIRPYQQDHGQRQPGPRPVLSACTRAAAPLRPEPTGC